jgi:hypothetical protein
VLGAAPGCRDRVRAVVSSIECLGLVQGVGLLVTKLVIASINACRSAASIR